MLAPLPSTGTARNAASSARKPTVETMVAMIAAARQFEAQMKSLSNAEGNDKAASQLLSVS